MPSRKKSREASNKVGRPGTARERKGTSAPLQHAGSKHAVLAGSLIESKLVLDNARALSVSLENAQAATIAQAARRFGVIDIGSNSIRLFIVELNENSTDRFSGEQPWTVLSEERAMTRLAHGASDKKQLASESMAQSVEAIGRFVAIAGTFGVRFPALRAFATAAVRDATNSKDFLSLVRDRAGIGIEIISGTEEGKFAFQSVARAFDLSQGRCAVVDIGGGSMEVVFSHDGVITGSSSMPLGAVRLTEQFGGAEDAAGERWKELRDHCERVIARSVPAGRGVGEDVPPHMLVGCGGTFNTLATLAAAARGVLINRNSPALRELGPVTRAQLRALTSQLRALPLADRLRVPGLPSDRADIIVSGLTSVERLMKHLAVGHIHTHAGGVREGLLLKVIADASRPGRFAIRTATKTRMAIQDEDALRELCAEMMKDARTLAQRCKYEQAHSEQVARLSLSIYDSLMRARPRHERQRGREMGALRGWGMVGALEPFERTILEAAGVLHDVGIMVEYRRHHKHSETIVRHADLAHWSDRDRELLAQVCRYHRRSEPSERHEAYAKLSDADQHIVQRLASVLRVADGLDRSHAQVVKSVVLKHERDVLRVEAVANGAARDERKAAASKGTMLEKLLGVSLEVSIEAVDAEIVIAPGAVLSAAGDAQHVKVLKRERERR